MNGFLYQGMKEIIFNKAGVIPKETHFHTQVRHYSLLEIMKQDADAKVQCGFWPRENISSRKPGYMAYKVRLTFPLMDSHPRAAASPKAEFYK